MKKKKKPEQNWFEILLNKTSSHFPSFPAYVKKNDRQTEMTRNIHPVSFTYLNQGCGEAGAYSGKSFRRLLRDWLVV